MPALFKNRLTSRELLATATALTAAAAVTHPVAASPSAQASPALVDLVHKLNELVGQSNANKIRIEATESAKDHARAHELGLLDEPICEARSDLEQQILEYPIASIGDLVILAKLAEHQHFYGQMSDDTPITLADSILRMFAGRPLIEPGEGCCADRPIPI